MFNSIRPINLNQILKLATGLLFVFVLGIVIPNESFACHREVPHGPHTCPDPGPTPTDPLNLTPCDRLLCLASVGKWSKPAARLYAERFGDSGNGSYTEIPPKKFDDILAALSEDTSDFCDLYKAYNVLIFQWKSPDIKNLNWQTLVDYMACGGGVVFEDPSNVDALDEGVTPENIHVKSVSGSPLTIAFDPLCGNAVPMLCDDGDDSPLVRNDSYEDIYAFDIDNNHMEFDDPQTLSANPRLKPFLRLLSGEVVGLYGELLDGGKVLGRIVLTGPDNSFHGNYPPGEYDPLPDAHQNQYWLLSNEIDWLLVGKLPLE